MNEHLIPFAAGLLDRDAAARKDAQALWADPNALILPFADLKPLIHENGALAPGHVRAGGHVRFCPGHQRVGNTRRAKGGA